MTTHFNYPEAKAPQDQPVVNKTLAEVRSIRRQMHHEGKTDGLRQRLIDAYQQLYNLTGSLAHAAVAEFYRKARSW